MQLSVRQFNLSGEEMKSSDKALLVTISFLVIYWRSMVFFGDLEYTKGIFEEYSQNTIIVGLILALFVFLYVNSRCRSDDTIYDSDKIKHVNGDNE